MSKHACGYRMISIALFLGLAILLVAPDATGEMSRSLKRKIDLLENVVDQVLIDSPNFLVSGRGTTHGLFLEEYGVLFTFEASLVSRDLDRGFLAGNWDYFKNLRFEQDDEGRIIIYREGDDEDDDSLIEILTEDELEDMDEEDLEELSMHQMRARDGKRQERRYESGKEELVEALIDYGDMLSDLDDGQSVAIVAFLVDSSFFDKEELSQLMIRAKMRDLRAYADGDIDEDEMIERVEIQED